MLKLQTLMATFILCSISVCPSSNNGAYHGLLEQIVKVPKIIGRRPLNDFRLKKKEIGDYEEYLTGQGKPPIDTGLLRQLIDKSGNPDTTAWSDLDFKRSIFVMDPAQQLNRDSTIRSLKREGCRNINQYRKLIDAYNSWSQDYYSNNPRMGKVSFYSRPVFDSTGNFAIVAYLLPKNRMAVSLYHFESNKWSYKGELYDIAF